MQFADKKVLVTGGSRGIGAAICTAFATSGAQVMVHYHEHQDAAIKVRANLIGQGHAIVQGDVSAIEDCERIVQQTLEAFGCIDILVNNAGIFRPHDIFNTDLATWELAFQQTFAINVFGPARLMYLVAHLMAKHGGGRIINISSRGAFRGEPTQPAYGSSKAALNALGQSLAQRLAPHGIYVGTVAPGFVETDMAVENLKGESGVRIRNQSPLGRVATPQEVAHATLFLASDLASFCTGTIIDVNGASYLR